MRKIAFLLRFKSNLTSLTLDVAACDHHTLLTRAVDDLELGEDKHSAADAQDWRGKNTYLHRLSSILVLRMGTRLWHAGLSSGIPEGDDMRTANIAYLDNVWIRKVPKVDRLTAVGGTKDLSIYALVPSRLSLSSHNVLSLVSHHIYLRRSCQWARKSSHITTLRMKTQSH